MSEELPRVAHVLMPERGMFLVCLPEGFDSPYGTRCIVHLDYGEDVAEVRCAATYDRPTTPKSTARGYRASA